MSDAVVHIYISLLCCTDAVNSSFANNLFIPIADLQPPKLVIGTAGSGSLGTIRKVKLQTFFIYYIDATWGIVAQVVSCYTGLISICTRYVIVTWLGSWIKLIANTFCVFRLVLRLVYMFFFFSFRLNVFYLDHSFCWKIFKLTNLTVLGQSRQHSCQ